jgi:L-cysteine desulfidase
MEHLTENQKYIAILREELVPAMGCTEPISLA